MGSRVGPDAKYDGHNAPPALALAPPLLLLVSPILLSAPAPALGAAPSCSAPPSCPRAAPSARLHGAAPPALGAAHPARRPSSCSRRRALLLSAPLLLLSAPPLLLLSAPPLCSTHTRTHALARRRSVPPRRHTRQCRLAAHSLAVLRTTAASRRNPTAHVPPVLATSCSHGPSPFLWPAITCRQTTEDKKPTGGEGSYSRRACMSMWWPSGRFVTTPQRHVFARGHPPSTSPTRSGGDPSPQPQTAHVCPVLHRRHLVCPKDKVSV